MRAVLSCLFLLIAGIGPAWSATPRDRLIAECDGKDLDRAIMACKALIASGTEAQEGLVATYTILGLAYLNKSMFKEAAETLTLAINLDGGSEQKYQNYVRRAVALNATCRLNDAIADTDRAIALRPSDPNPYETRGLVYLRMGDLVRAKLNLKTAHDLKPNLYPPVEQVLTAEHPGACHS